MATVNMHKNLLKLSCVVSEMCNGWRKQIGDDLWPRSVWVGECFFSGCPRQNPESCKMVVCVY